ncbi:hypothetical protein [Prevotella melaninogenica]|uniref:Uncharacterized protein n=1 Tax=Prevotella melaninogenica TaxID=28132 RepID=A0A250KJ87_9BACT|nr:hypothetical protein [Prevotella melaninogenica]BBA29779.1 hypothetical protein PMEL_200303 [Prevotella melaninogenica]
MKKLLLTLAFALTVTALNAQTLIKAKFQEGERAVYETVTNIEGKSAAAGSEAVKITRQTKITVQEILRDGYIIEMLTKGIAVDGNQAFLRQTGDMIIQSLNNVPMLLRTDANGKITDILNYDEVQRKAWKFALTELDSLYNNNPNVEKSMPKMKAMMSITKEVAKDVLIANINNNTFFYLFGKSLKTGYTEDRYIKDIKAAVTYTLTKKGITTNIVEKISNNMTEAEVKAFIIDKMKGVGADENLELMIAQLEAHWDRMKEIGMATMDINGTTNFQLLKNGWPTEYSSKIKANRMGVDITINSVTKLVQKNWK